VVVVSPTRSTDLHLCLGIRADQHGTEESWEILGAIERCLPVW